MQVTDAAKGQPAFFRTNNGGYGTAWEAGRTDDPTEVPQYRELVSQKFGLIKSSLHCKNYETASYLIISILLKTGSKRLGAQEFAEDV